MGMVSLNASGGRLFLSVGCLGLLGLLASGCGGGPDLPPMAPVSGQVTLDGKPLSVGFVQFVPEGPGEKSAPPGVGNIGTDGRYEITTAGVRGAVVGSHKIRVEATEPRLSDDDPPGVSLIPLRYNNPATSSLTAEVKADQENNVPLELTSDP